MVMANGFRVMVTLTLFCFAAYLLAEFTWKLLDGPAGRPLSQTSVFRETPDAAQRSSGPEIVPSVLTLFGSATRQEIIPDQDTSEDIPETTLNLILKGIINARPKQRALAIISKKDKKAEEEIYAVGDEIPGGALVREIFVDRVILLRSGKLETLLIEESEKQATASVSYGSRETNIVSRGDGVHWRIEKSYLNSQLSNLAVLAREIGIDVYKQNNVQKGYRLVSSRGSKILNSLGLNPGDVLEEVNGIQLRNASQGLMAYQKLKNASEVKLVVNRNGVRKTMIYSIN